MRKLFGFFIMIFPLIIITIFIIASVGFWFMAAVWATVTVIVSFVYIGAWLSYG